MTKKLLVQIKNEWRNNLWLALELLVVSVVMWFVVDYLYTGAATYLEPRGFDISHCYLIEMGKSYREESRLYPARPMSRKMPIFLNLWTVCAAALK